MSTARVRPRFAGMVRGEALKLSRQLSLWLSLAGAVLLLGVIVLAISGGDQFRSTLASDPTGWSYNNLVAFGTVFQIGAGIFLLVFGARLFGMEYSAGTIRILYARGTGRLQLLLAKVFTLAVVGLALFAGFVVSVGAILTLLTLSIHGNLDPLAQISNAFWQDLARWALVQAISAGMAILLAAAAAALGRSLAFAISAALAFYPADNFLNILELLAIRATGHTQPWEAISQYQLGPNLNVLLTLIEPTHRTRPAFAQPLAPVDATHASVVIGAFVLAFAALAVVRTLRPDVLE